MRTVFLLLFLSTTVFAQQRQSIQTDSSAGKWRHVVALYPILAGGGFSAVGQGTFIEYEIGAEFRYGLDLWQDRYRIGPSIKLFGRTQEGQLSGPYYLLGLYQQYDFLHRQRNRLFLEVGGYYSNFCLCESGIILPSSALGFGLELPTSSLAQWASRLSQLVTICTGWCQLLLVQTPEARLGLAQTPAGAAIC